MRGAGGRASAPRLPEGQGTSQGRGRRGPSSLLLPPPPLSPPPLARDSQQPSPWRV